MREILGVILVVLFLISPVLADPPEGKGNKKVKCAANEVLVDGVCIVKYPEEDQTCDPGWIWWIVGARAGTLIKGEVMKKTCLTILLVLSLILTAASYAGPDKVKGKCPDGYEKVKGQCIPTSCPDGYQQVNGS